MPASELANIWWLSLACYGLAVVSAVVPWVNAEVLLLSASPMAGSRADLAMLVLAVTTGQLTGDSIMYWLSRRAICPPSRRL